MKKSATTSLGLLASSLLACAAALLLPASAAFAQDQLKPPPGPVHQAPGAPGPQDLRGETAQDADELLNDLRVAEAGRIIAALAEKRPDAPEVHYLQGRHAFLTGDYKGAVARLKEAVGARGDREDWSYMLKLAEDTAKVTRRYERHLSPDGRFEIRIAPGKDEVLLPHAFEVLGKAYDTLTKVLGTSPPLPIRVEVYPRTTTLAQVSLLTEEEIRTSGTIALCKYNRLMVTSPKALLRGYGWADTLVHELIHYLIHYEAGERVPIWMHEGMAKFLERRWRGADTHRLPPSSEKLLATAVEKNELITFEQMHPSMAKLPSQEAAATAFAEVYTVMEYLHQEVGEVGFGQLLDRIAAGDEAPEAFARVLEKPNFHAFERDWLGYLKRRPVPDDLPDDEAGFEDRLVFQDASEKPTDLSQIPEPRARDHFKLGLLLQGRQRPGAAVVQYRKAVARMGAVVNPILQTRLAESLLEVGKPSEALEALSPAARVYPGYVAIWIGMGRAALELGRMPDALRYLQEAAYINPYNPEIHELLARVHDKLGQKDSAQQARRFAKLVR